MQFDEPVHAYANSGAPGPRVVGVRTHARRGGCRLAPEASAALVPCQERTSRGGEKSRLPPVLELLRVQLVPSQQLVEIRPIALREPRGLADVAAGYLQ